MIAPQEVIFANELLGLVHIVWRDNSYFVNVDSEESRDKFCTFLTEKSGHQWLCWENPETDDLKRKWVFYREDQFEVEQYMGDMVIHALKTVDQEIDLPLNTDTYSSLFASAAFENPTLVVSPIEMQKVKRMDGMFIGCHSLVKLDVSNWDVSSVKTMKGMFCWCKSLAKLYVSDWDVSSVEDMMGMFSNCFALVYLDVSRWNISNVKDMKGMFSGCIFLSQLDVSNWDISNAKDISDMFIGCTSLVQLDISGWNVSNIENIHDIFFNCPAGKTCLPILVEKRNLQQLNTF